MFIDRTDELEILERGWASDRAEFLVLYGRRRVGKSRLLTHFAGQGHRMLIFEATSGTSADNLEDISRQIADFTGSVSQAEQPFTSWRAVFAAFEEIIRDEKTMIVLDEFQFIAREVDELGSLVNRLVENNQDNGNLLLVVSGSDVSFFAREVMGYGSTMYGRRTASHRLLPFRFRQTREFVPDLSVEDQIRTFAVFGGMPYYLNDLHRTDSVRDAILNGILLPGAKLREEPTYLFAQESRIRDAGAYRSIVKAIANGGTRPNQVAQAVKIDRRNIDHHLDQLYEMNVLAKRYPVTEREAARRFYLEIEDPFLRFWFRFVGPYESRLLDRGRATRHLDETIMPALDEFTSNPAFEEICRQWTEDNHPDVASIGSWWGSIKERPRGGRPVNVRYEVDVAGVDENGTPVVLGSCKWTNSSHPVAELDKLRTIRRHLDCPEAHLFLFSRSGVDPAISQAAEVDPLIDLIAVSDF